MEEKRDSVEEKLENMEEKPASVNKGTEETEEKPASASKGSEGTEKKTASAEEKTESAEERSEAQSTGEAAADKTDNKSKDKKKQEYRKKMTGIAELAVAFLLIALSAWLFINTRGTRLLYVSVATGRISRYYWVFFVIAAMFTILGLVTLKSSRRKGRENLPEKDKQTRKEE